MNKNVNEYYENTYDIPYIISVRRYLYCTLIFAFIPFLVFFEPKTDLDFALLRTDIFLTPESDEDLLSGELFIKTILVLITSQSICIINI